MSLWKSLWENYHATFPKAIEAIERHLNVSK